MQRRRKRGYAKEKERVCKRERKGMQRGEDENSRGTKEYTKVKKMNVEDKKIVCKGG